METFWGLFEKRIVDMQDQEKVMLVLLITACLMLVAYAVSLLLQVAKRWDRGQDQCVPPSISARRSLFQLDATDHGREVRVSDTD